MLTFFRALVPDIHIEAVSVMSNERGFYLCMRPNHQEWWIWFRSRHPDFISLAHAKFNAIRKTEDGLPYLCPVFPTREDLFGWLADVFSLSLGMRKLIRLVMA